MGFDSMWHWLVLLVIVLLVFGTKRIRHLGPDLGAAIRGFKKSLGGEDEESPTGEEARRKEAEQLRADPPPAEPVGSSATQSQPGSGHAR